VLPSSASGASQEKELREIRELLGEANREWNGMLEAVHELKEALGPIDFATAFKAYCASRVAARPADAAPAKPPAAVPAVPEKRPAPAAPAAPTAPAVTTAPASAAAPPAAPAVERARPPVTARPAPAAAETGPLAAPREATEIDAKLGELLKLVKEGLVSRPGESPSRVEIPRHLTQEIAREVAGRVKDSVLSSIQQQGAAADEVRLAPPAAAPAPARAAPRRIPLDDIGAIIDQITRQ
jgi:hypothetical protein